MVTGPAHWELLLRARAVDTQVKKVRKMSVVNRAMCCSLSGLFVPQQGTSLQTTSHGDTR